MLDLLRPFLVEIASILVIAFMGWLVPWLRARFQVEIDREHRDALQTALTNAAGAVIARLGTRPGGLTGGSATIGVDYVRAAVPDAVARFKLSDAEIAEKVVAKIGVLSAPTARVA